MLAKRPKIIHISCHGDWDNRKKEFYIEIEEVGTGISQNFYQADLQELLKDVKKYGVQLAFVSACNSEEISNMFAKCGIPAVISVNSQFKISDQAAQTFAKNLYMHLLEGYSV